MRIRALLQEAAAAIAELQEGSARLDSELLMMHVTKYNRVQLITHDLEELPLAKEQEFKDLLQKRLTGEPIAYLLGERDFWDFKLKVTPATLIPRPDTEIIVEKALTLLDCYHGTEVLDLGTGSGAIIMALKHSAPQIHASAVDISPEALAVAKENAARYNLKIDFYLGSWFSPWQSARQSARQIARQSAAASASADSASAATTSASATTVLPGTTSASASSDDAAGIAPVGDSVDFIDSNPVSAGAASFVLVGATSIGTAGAAIAPVRTGQSSVSFSLVDSALSEHSSLDGDNSLAGDGSLPKDSSLAETAEALAPGSDAGAPGVEASSARGADAVVSGAGVAGAGAVNAVLAAMGAAAASGSSAVVSGAGSHDAVRPGAVVSGASSLLRSETALAAPLFDVIVSNPPYIDPEDPHLTKGDVRFEPKSALVAPDHGLADLKYIASTARHFLKSGGYLLFEHGYDQGLAMREVLTKLGYHKVETICDYGGNERVTLGQWPRHATAPESKTTPEGKTRHEAHTSHEAKHQYELKLPQEGKDKHHH